MRILIILLMFFIVGALIIITNYDLALIDNNNVESFSELYLDWIGKIYSNIQVLTGEGVRLAWSPE